MASRKKKRATKKKSPPAEPVVEADSGGSTPIEPEVLGPEIDDSSAVSPARIEVIDVTEGTPPATTGETGPAVVELPGEGGTMTRTGASSRALSPSTSSSLPARRSSEGVARVGPLQAFLRQVGRYPVLSADEEHTLAVEVFEKSDPVAAQKLAVHNLRLVVKMAYRYRRAWASLLDLIQEGNVGLVEAVRRFDPFRGARFSTYAAYWIRAYMLRFLLDHSRMVRISRTRAGRKMFFRLSKEREKLRALGIEPGPKLLAEKLGVSEKDFNEVVKHMDQSEVRLDAPVSNDGEGGSTILDTLSGVGESPEAAAHRLQFHEDVSKALESFRDQLRDDRERACWDEHILAEDPVSLSVLGERFGVTKQRMGQIVGAIRKRLRGHLLEVLGPEVELGYTLGPN